MRMDEGPPRAAPSRFPYAEHPTVREVWGEQIFAYQDEARHNAWRASLPAQR